MPFVTIIGLQNARSYLTAACLRGEQVIDLAGAEDAGTGTAILIRDHESAYEDRGIVQASGVPGAG